MHVTIVLAPLDINLSGNSWTLAHGRVMPGFTQIPGIAEATAFALLSRREEQDGFEDAKDILKVKGIGPKTLESITNFMGEEDPFNLQVLGDKLMDMREQLGEGVAADESGFIMLPEPTHTAVEIPYERTGGGNIPVVFLGVVRSRNLKDLFEAHHSRTGTHLDPANVKDPMLNEWVVMLCEDDTDVVTVTINRWHYRRFKELIWSIAESEDLVLFRGYKMSRQSRRAIYANEFWIIDPDEEDSDDKSL